ncbi:MAG: lipoyl(octanoyl) transferase LipB [Hyphomicrobiaceae bacterium]|nr:lipoyl(octanoyl) transferase LipB [Hyphomicrobiaceae bacterium]
MTAIATTAAKHRGAGPIEWRISDAPVAYEDALAEMSARATAIANGTASELIWLIEHPPLYTAGTSARPEDLLQPDRFPVYTTGRGGQYTYHGPGQRVVYLMLDLKARGGDVRAYVRRLEAWIIATLAEFGVEGGVRDGRVGVWVTRADGHGRSREDKIAAIGVRVSRGVTTHGLAINVAPDLSHYGGIVPCGIAEHGVTSLADLGLGTTMKAVYEALHAHVGPVLERPDGAERYFG